MNAPAPTTQPTTPDHPPAPPRRRRTWLRVLLHLVIFVSGAVVGVVVTLGAVRVTTIHAIHHPEEMPARIAARMARVLSLDEQQTQEVEQILRARHKTLQGIRREFHPWIEEQLDLLRDEVSTVLDDQQREKWLNHFNRLRQTWVPPLPPEAEPQPDGEPQTSSP